MSGFENMLVQSALAAVSKAFLTKDGGVRYGAAALSASGNIYTSGQYSSFNHVTNIHAEQGAIAIATAAGEPDIVALAVASAPSKKLTTPCGICRQVMLEHASRTGRDFYVYMVSPDGSFVKRKVSELLPESWSSHRQDVKSSPADGRETRSGKIEFRKYAPGETVSFGKHVVLGDGNVGLVHEARIFPGRILAKIKYERIRGRKASWRKVPHFFTESSAYQSILIDRGWSRPAPWGGMTHIYHESEVAGVVDTRPLMVLGRLIPAALRELWEKAGINMSSLAVTGSRSLGIHGKTSDWDIVVPASPDTALRVRQALSSLFSRGDLSIPPDSGTWKLFSRVCGREPQALVKEGRFAERFDIGGQSMSLVFTSELDKGEHVMNDSWAPLGRGIFHGTVFDDSFAPFKRACFKVLSSDGKTVEAVCYHKMGNIVKNGDRVSICGWKIKKGTLLKMLLFSQSTDTIVIHRNSK